MLALSLLRRDAGRSSGTIARISLLNNELKAEYPDLAGRVLIQAADRAYTTASVLGFRAHGGSEHLIAGALARDQLDTLRERVQADARRTERNAAPARTIRGGA